MAAEHFDVVVIGRSLAGLLTAGLLARRRFRVRVMDQAGAPPLERGPLFGDTPKSVHRVIEELGLQHTFRTRLEGAWRPVTVALPDRRLVLPTAERARGVELGRMFPGCGSGLVDLFNRVEGYGESLGRLLDGAEALPPVGWRGRRNWQRAIEGVAAWQLVHQPIPWTEMRPLMPLVAALLRVAGQTGDGAGHMTPLGARALWHLSHGIVPMRTGRAGFAEMVSEKIDVLNGHIDGRRQAASLEVHRKKVTAVVTTDGHRIGADAVVIAGGEPALARLWADAPPFESLPGRRMRLRIHRDDVPVDLRDPCGWLPDLDGPAHLVRLSGDRMVLSWTGGRSAPPLDRLVPFARLSDIETDPMPTPPESDFDPLGLFRRPLDGHLSNQIFVGDWVLPGLGLEGACLTAWHGAARLAAIGPRRWRGRVAGVR